MKPITKAPYLTLRFGKDKHRLTGKGHYQSYVFNYNFMVALYC